MAYSFDSQAPAAALATPSYAIYLLRVCAKINPDRPTRVRRHTSFSDICFYGYELRISYAYGVLVLLKRYIMILAKLLRFIFHFERLY